MLYGNAIHFYLLVGQQLLEWADEHVGASFVLSLRACLSLLQEASPCRLSHMRKRGRVPESFSATGGPACWPWRGRRSLSLTCLTKTFVRHIWVAAAQVLLLCSSPPASSSCSYYLRFMWPCFTWCIILFHLPILWVRFKYVSAINMSLSSPCFSGLLFISGSQKGAKGFVSQTFLWKETYFQTTTKTCFLRVL